MTTTTTTTPTIKVTEYYDHEKATKDLREYDADLSIEFMRQPALYAYYSALLVQAEAQYDRLSHTAEIGAARLDQAVRDEAAKAGSKVTEKQITTRISLDPRMIEMERAVRLAKVQVGYLKSTCQALVQRKDMLMQMGFIARKEQDANGMSITKSSMKDIQNARLNRLSDLYPTDDLD